MQFQSNFRAMVNYHAVMHKFNDTRKSLSKEVVSVTNFLAPAGTVRRYTLFKIVPPVAIILIALLIFEKIGGFALGKLDIEPKKKSPHIFWHNTKVEHIVTGGVISLFALAIFGICIIVSEKLGQNYRGWQAKEEKRVDLENQKEKEAQSHKIY